MKQKFTVTGMTCPPNSGYAAVGAPRGFDLRGRNEFALAPRFCNRQNTCTRHLARALSCVAEQITSEVSVQ